ncbi:hypothetical protein [Amphritea sp.]|uniref:hypothetical protein n=1 Tax=Amphritea sp. TaxID=1872502 RepID=UPI003A8EE486
MAHLVLREDDVRLPGYFMPHIKGDSLMVQLGIHMASLVFSMADILYEKEVDTYITINMSADQLRSTKLI